MLGRSTRVGLATAVGVIGLVGAIGGAGAATPAQVPITIRITKLSERHRAIKLSATIRPAAALVRNPAGIHAVELDRLAGPNTYQQLAGGSTQVPRSGRFTLKSVSDPTGRLARNRYAIVFTPAAASGYQKGFDQNPFGMRRGRCSSCRSSVTRRARLRSLRPPARQRWFGGWLLPMRLRIAVTLPTAIVLGGHSPSGGPEL